MSNEYVSLENLGSGAAIERFDDEFQRVLENIVDPNTTDAMRSITLKVSIKPDEKRSFCKVAVDCHSRLASVKPFGATIFVGRDINGVVATEYNPNQPVLPGVDTNKVADIKGGKEK